MVKKYHFISYYPITNNYGHDAEPSVVVLTSEQLLDVNYMSNEVMEDYCSYGYKNPLDENERQYKRWHHNLITQLKTNNFACKDFGASRIVVVPATKIGNVGFNFES